MHKPMDLDERFALCREADALLDAGDREGYQQVMKKYPMPPYLAKVFKEKIGLDFLINGGWNLTEVEEHFGKEWLSK